MHDRYVELARQVALNAAQGETARAQAESSGPAPPTSPETPPSVSGSTAMALPATLGG